MRMPMQLSSAYAGVVAAWAALCLVTGLGVVVVRFIIGKHRTGRLLLVATMAAFVFAAGWAYMLVRVAFGLRTTEGLPAGALASIALYFIAVALLYWLMPEARKR